MGYIKLNIDEKVYWSTLDGVRYLTADFSELTDFQVLEAILHVTSIMKKEKEASIRVLTIVSGMDVGFSTQMTLKKLSKDIQPFIFKSAMVGVEGFLKPIHQIYSKFTSSKAVLFDTVDEALVYICS